MVKDHRTKEEVGDIDVFVKTHLRRKAAGTPGQAQVAGADRG